MNLWEVENEWCIYLLFIVVEMRCRKCHSLCDVELRKKRECGWFLMSFVHG